MSIPTWTYAEDFYRDLLQSRGLEIKTDPVKGKGLFASKEFEVGNEVLVETALCCTQNIDDALRNIPVCGNCLASLESPRAIFTRVTKDRAMANELPNLAAYNARKRRVVRCLNEVAGCPMVFCSVRCRETAWIKFHCVGCRGTMDPEQQAAYDQFVSAPWQQGGIDFSDTHYLALRFMSDALTKVRLHKTSVEQAYAPMTQLIRTPLSMFTFSFLLRDDGDSSDVDSRWARFQQYKKTPLEEPAVVAANKDGPKKEDMLEEGFTLLDRIFHFTPEEKAYFSLDKWSSLLGAVLLNGQERTPSSPFVEYTEMANAIKGGDVELSAFMKKARAANKDTNLCNTSTRGQGIYTVGCLFNHSCEPNLQVQYCHENDETLVAVCIRPIKSGDEVTISYINEDLPVQERLQQLYEHYLFDCSCVKCTREAPGGVPKAPEQLAKDEENERFALDDAAK